MPRVGLSWDESVLRVPKETSLRMVRSMLRASISEMMRAMSALRIAFDLSVGATLSCWLALRLRCACEVGTSANVATNKARHVNAAASERMTQFILVIFISSPFRFLYVAWLERR